MATNRSAKKCKEKFENHVRPILVTAMPKPQTRSLPGMSRYNSTVVPSSSTYSDERPGVGSRNREWKDFLGRIMDEVIKKQEEMQKQLLEAIERIERQRADREEAWRMQEMIRINKEREILAQERSALAAKDGLLMSFLEKLAKQCNLQVGQVQVEQISLPPHGPVEPSPSPAARNDGIRCRLTGSSRWPKAEVEALIKIKTGLDDKYQESGPRGPLWDEISASMRALGYEKSSKRCKEKWENINKYFKKVKESNKRRPKDSKTCPYFHQLDALYRTKKKVSYSTSDHVIPLMNSMVPLMVRPERQWPPNEDVLQTGLERENSIETDHAEEDNTEEGEEPTTEMP
ncbi:hypothetical protein CDL15_Pgr027831 [Punica granatum]|nr:hypothetical protein CDL15_Pgr027831 [Punica granatum]PKI57432.1 hypothetical protein CRG98_022083 [Punica granatum]